MTLDFSVVGHSGPELPRSWTDRDTMLYALSVGAAPAADGDELRLVAENCEGLDLVALPTYAAVLAQVAGLRPPLGDFPGTAVVHAGQAIRLNRALPTAGTVLLRSQVASVYDKGSGALATSVTTAVDDETGEQLFETESSIFIRGEGGFGGYGGPSGSWAEPDRPPDRSSEVATLPTQALLYRLNGDRNPLHACPETARRAGFEAPILHGLCTYGIGVRTLLLDWGAHPADVAAVEGRFSSPVLPGEILLVDSWEDRGALLFRVSTASAGTVVDHGRVVLR